MKSLRTEDEPENLGCETTELDELATEFLDCWDECRKKELIAAITEQMEGGCGIKYVKANGDVYVLEQFEGEEPKLVYIRPINQFGE